MPASGRWPPAAAEAGVLTAALPRPEGRRSWSGPSGLLRLRRRYEQVETVLDFYGDAVNTRTNPRLGAVLRGLDTFAVDSMDRVLRPLGMATPPVLTYLDKGIGASILRSGARLWDAGALTRGRDQDHPAQSVAPHLAPARDGHQVAHLTGWTDELAAALDDGCAGFRLAAESWRGWASEIAADVYAFVAGRLRARSPPWPPWWTGPPAGLPDAVRRPPSVRLVRVLFNAGLCRSWFGPGPWDDLARAWMHRHPLEFASRDVQAIGRASLAQLPALADVCTRTPMRAFGGVPITAFADPERCPRGTCPAGRRAGASLYTSSYLRGWRPCACWPCRC